MSLPYRQQYQLGRIESRLVSSDPHLAGMLGVFGRLSAGHSMPGWERLPARRDRVRQAAALLVQAVTVVAAALSLALRAVLVLAGAAIPRPGRRLPMPKPGRTRGRRTRGRRTRGTRDSADWI